MSVFNDVVIVTITHTTIVTITNIARELFGYRSIVEVYIDIISRFMNGKEDKDTIRKRLTDFPNIQAGDIDRTPPTTQYIDLPLLKDPANMEYFKSIIQKLAYEILAENPSAE
ncbi:MAG: hypothetical protein E7239_09430 [Sarcina sp.]|nr:hypothetical protein [Sarcina sp.]